MSESYDADVAVIGYGPTGLVAALTLAKNGMKVAAFERDESIYPRSRAVTFNDWTMRILQDLGVDERVAKVVEAQRGLRWLTYDKHEVMRVIHTPSVFGPGARLYNVYQPLMESELRAAGTELHGENIEVRYEEVTGLDQDDTGVTVSSQRKDGGTRTTRARYAIAADGGSSPSRDWLGIKLLGETGDGQWIIVDTFTKRWWPDRDFLTFWTDRERPVVDIATAAGTHRWELPLKPGETPDDYRTEDKVWPLLNSMGHDDKDVRIHQWAFYRHHTRMADTWRKGRVFLAGDAAHLMPPWAGAGMQSGMRDAFDLGWKLSRVVKGELPPAWLDTYETERRPNVAFFTDLAEKMGHLIKGIATPEEMRYLNEPDPDAKVTPWESPVSQAPKLVDGWFRGPLDTDDSPVGRMIPQPLMSDSFGKIQRLDHHLGPEFVLLGAETGPESVLTAEEKAGWDALGASYRAVRRQDAWSESDTDLIDLEAVILPWMQRYGTTVIALRPDKFVAAADKSGIAVPF